MHSYVCMYVYMYMLDNQIDGYYAPPLVLATEFSHRVLFLSG